MVEVFTSLWCRDLKRDDGRVEGNATQRVKWEGILVLCKRTNQAPLKRSKATKLYMSNEFEENIWIICDPSFGL